MKNLFILLIGCNSLVFSVYSENLLNREEDSLYQEKTTHDRYGRRLHDRDIFADHIEGSSSALDYKTVTNNTNDIMYVQVSYGGAISFGRFGAGGRSYWHANLQPKECIKIYQSNSNISPDFYDPIIVTIEIPRGSGTKKICYPCGNKNLTLKGFFIKPYLFEGDGEFNDDCDNNEDLTWHFPRSS